MKMTHSIICDVIPAKAGIFKSLGKSWIASGMMPLILCLSILLLSSCTVQRTSLDTQAHRDLILQEDAEVFAEGIEVLSLSIEDALARALEKNLDGRVSALEVLAQSDQINLARMGALPNLEFSYDYIGRSNEGASSSQSVLTGTQSLEPSFSTEQYRDTQTFSLNWNLINILLAVSQTKNAQDEFLIAAERHEKVKQNIARDVYTAYWRALAVQETDQETRKVLSAARHHLNKLKTADKNGLLSKTRSIEQEQQIRDAITGLEDIQHQSTLAMLELKSLLSLPQQTKVFLTSAPSHPNQQIKAYLKQDIRDLEREALLNRPEVRELILQKNVSDQALRDEIIRTVPGGELFFALNRDSNQFLRDSRWGSFSASIAQNLTSLISLPTRRKAAKNDQKILDARRNALVLAVMTQVHLSRQRLDYLHGLYHAREKAAENSAFSAFSARKSATQGFSAKQQVLMSRMQAQAKKIEKYQALADLQNAYAEMELSLGRPPL